MQLYFIVAPVRGDDWDRFVVSFSDLPDKISDGASSELSAAVSKLFTSFPGVDHIIQYTTENSHEVNDWELIKLFVAHMLAQGCEPMPGKAFAIFETAWRRRELEALVRHARPGAVSNEAELSNFIQSRLRAADANLKLIAIHMNNAGLERAGEYAQELCNIAENLEAMATAVAEGR